MDESQTDRKKPRLYESIRDDLANISDWRDKVERLAEHRLGLRKRSTLYPGAPNFVEPIIDNNIRDNVAQNLSVMFSSRQLANFIPFSSGAAEHQREAEMGFDSMLRMMIEFELKMENALDNKFERGFAVLKMKANRTAYGRVMGKQQGVEIVQNPDTGDLVEQIIDLPTPAIPDLEVVDPYSFVVPTSTKCLQDAERCTHIHRYTEREFLKLGKEREWKDFREVLRQAKEKHEGRTEDHQNSGGYTPHISLEVVDDSLLTIPVWEVYHYKGQRKYRTIFSPTVSTTELESKPWIWNDDGTERPWPFVQLRHENRRLEFYDTRGVAELLIDNQKIANSMQNAKGVQLDFYSKPMLSGARGKTQNIKWIPGEVLPDGVELVNMPNINGIFDYSTNAEYAKAQRRSGSAQGGFGDARGAGDKTATQVNAEQIANQRLTNVSVLRDGEPMSQFYSMMWEYLKHNPVALPIISESKQFQGEVSDAIYALPFKVTSAASSQHVNPDFVLQQLMTLGPILAQSPYIQRHELDAIMVDQINPQLTSRLVYNPNEGGQVPPPLQMQFDQLAQQGQQVAQQVQSNSKQVDNLTEYVGKQAVQEMEGEPKNEMA